MDVAILIIGALALACLWCVDDADPEIHPSDNPWSDSPDSRDVAPPPVTPRESGLFFALIAVFAAAAIALSLGAS